MIGQVRSREMIKSISQVAERYAHKDTLLAARHLLELGEGPVGGLGEVRHGEPVRLVGPQTLHAAHHPVVVPGLRRLGHVLTRPLHVPLVPRLVLPGAHARVSLKIGKYLVNNIPFLSVCFTCLALFRAFLL